MHLSTSLTDNIDENDVQEAESCETRNIYAKVKVVTQNSFWLCAVFIGYATIIPSSNMIIKVDTHKNYLNSNYSIAMLLFVLNCTNLIGYSIAAIYQGINPFARWKLNGMLKLLVFGMLKALAVFAKTIVFAKLPVETAVAFNYTCIVWISILTLVKERRKPDWLSAMPVIAIVFGIASYICLALEGANSVTRWWAALGLFRPFLDAVNAYLVAGIFNTDFAEWSQTERGFAFVFIQAITCCATTPIEAMINFFIQNDHTAFHAKHFTPFIGWSWLTPSTIITFGIGCVCYVKLSENAVLKTIAAYAGELLQVLTSFAIFDPFRPVSFLLMCTLLLLSVDYKLGYAAHKQQQRLEELVKKLKASLASKDLDMI